MENYSASSSQTLAVNERTELVRRLLLATWLSRVVRIVIASLFLWSGLTKIFDPRGFAVVIDAFGLIPETWVMAVAVGLPILELIAGIGLLCNVTGSLTLIAGLLAGFMALLAYGILLGLDVDCGCFGPEDPEAIAFHGLRTALYRDLFIMAGIVYLYGWRYHRSIKPVRWIHLI